MDNAPSQILDQHQVSSLIYANYYRRHKNEALKNPNFSFLDERSDNSKGHYP